MKIGVPKRSSPGVPCRDDAGVSARSWTTATRDGRAGCRAGIGVTMPTTRGPGRRWSAPPPRCLRRRDIVKVKEPQAAERTCCGPGRRCSPTFTSRRIPTGARARYERGGVHRLRDRDFVLRRAAAARADVRSGGTHGHSGGRLLSREGARGYGGADLRGAGVDPAKVVILGGGVVGSTRDVALGMGADVWVSTPASTSCAGCGRSSGGRSTPSFRRTTPSSAT